MLDGPELMKGVCKVGRRISYRDRGWQTSLNVSFWRQTSPELCIVALEVYRPHLKTKRGQSYFPSCFLLVLNFLFSWVCWVLEYKSRFGWNWILWLWSLFPMVFTVMVFNWAGARVHGGTGERRRRMLVYSYASLTAGSNTARGAVK